VPRKLTEQEEFWSESFGSDYLLRNQGEQLLAKNLVFFATALRSLNSLESCLEMGANVGMNLEAIKLIFPNANLYGVEINTEAANPLSRVIPKDNIFEGSFLDFKSDLKFDLVISKTVLIHINPEMLRHAYQALYETSLKYILIAEYYNPTPVSVTYRGHEDRLFKRDFAGEMLDKYEDLSLVDYGFFYHREDELYDDINWFLLKKSK